jgi:hypothetical protein
MRAFALRIPSEHRPDLLRAVSAIAEDVDDYEGIDVADVDELDAQLRHAQPVTASPALLWRTLMWALNAAGAELHGLCEAMQPSREDIEARMREIAFCLDALDVISSLHVEPVA